MNVTVRLTDEEIELAILAVEAYAKEHIADYDGDDRPTIAAELDTLATKLRHA